MKLISTIEQDEITKKLSQSFDYEFDGSVSFQVPLFDVPEQYQIGLIVGASGSGKSSILNTIGKASKIEWDSSKAICSHFATSDEAQDKLNAVGLNSIPSWLKPYHVLSTGERFRADLSRSLVDNAIIDEFTSVVDRNVAKSCSYAINRYIRKSNIQKMVFASCHYDIIEWLQPDWVFDTNTHRLTVGRGSERPSLQLEVVPCNTEAWTIFCNHHYLSSKLNKGSRCWLATWENQVVGFASAIPFPSGSLKNAWKGHRTVVLPDFQGLGIGVRLSDAIGQIFVNEGYRYFSKSSHVRLGEYRNNSPKWRPTAHNMKDRKQYYKKLNDIANGVSTTKDFYSSELRKKHASRICYCHEYIGIC